MLLSHVTVDFVTYGEDADAWMQGLDTGLESQEEGHQLPMIIEVDRFASNGPMGANARTILAKYGYSQARLGNINKDKSKECALIWTAPRLRVPDALPVDFVASFSQSCAMVSRLTVVTSSPSDDESHAA